MKHPFLTLLIGILLCSSCHTNTPSNEYTPTPVGSFANGADLSWLTEQEADNVLFYDSIGTSKECMLLLRDLGMNAVRLRVWVNHSTGWCNKEDVLVKARRAAGLHLRLMIDFHYSDFFADPGQQTTPHEWQNYTYEELQTAVATHTKEILQALRDEHITPEWVQVGNETRNGMLWDTGKLWTENGQIDGGWKRYATLTTVGYNAVKEVFPEAQVIVHIDNAWEDNRWFYRELKKNGGKWDIIGLSHYPQTHATKTWKEMNTLAISHIQDLHKEFNCPVMVCEIGTKSQDLTLATQVITDFIEQAKPLYNSQQASTLAGIFYWEPQVYNAWRPQEYIPLGWGAYNMGAFTTDGKPSEALRILWQENTPKSIR